MLDKNFEEINGTSKCDKHLEANLQNYLYTHVHS